MNRESPLNIKGFEIYKAFLPLASQVALVDDLRRIAEYAPMLQPVTPGGKQMSVRMTAAGRVGWVTDQSGYRYESSQPNGFHWPKIPARILSLWSELVGDKRQPDCCLINFYGKDARMGLHQDRDEGDFDWPVVSVSLGDDGLFRMGNAERGGATESLWLQSGDVVVMGGAARLAYHGVDRIRFGSSTLLPKGGRLNITLRVVDPSVSPSS